MPRDPRRHLTPELRAAIREHVHAHPLALWDGKRFKDAVSKLAAVFGSESAEAIAETLREEVKRAKKPPQ